MAQLNANFPNFYIQWPNNAALTLIRRRRVYQGQFATTALRSQNWIWRAIANEVNNANPGFAPTRRQCRTKWNSLKSGYENLKRLQNGNPEGYRTHTPSLHDERFHEELSDEFWLVERNYLFFNWFYLFNSLYIN